jgi:hypothetical protein
MTAWFGVRCVFRFDPAEHGDASLYEERITLWSATTFDEAMALAEEEAHAYVEGLGGAYLGLAQAYELPEPPGHGLEVFSLMRESFLGDDDYLEAFFTTGTEQEGDEDA